MVFDYPEKGTKEYLPAKHIRETAALWDSAGAVTMPKYFI